MFTAEQLEDFKSFRKIQMSARFNMLDPRARRSAKLTPEEYRFVMDNYVELHDALKATEAL